MGWTERPRKRAAFPGTLLSFTAAAGLLLPIGGVSLGEPAGPASAVTTSHVVFAWNDLGMHCMNSDFSEIMVLPPFNTLHAQVIRRGGEPDIITGNDAQVRYFIPSNTHSADKTNFWEFPQPLLGAAPLPEVGITGSRMAGVMSYTGALDYNVIGVPLVPMDDDGRENPYPLATVEVRRNNALVARTQAVVPVSTEMSCNLCHNDPTVSTASDILMDHDRLHGTSLMSQRPVLCAGCHGSNALGLPGQPGRASLSSAMHTAHSTRMGGIQFAEACYACHPGIRTACQRDVHLSNGVTCTQCHGNMSAVGNPARRPWIDEPTCGSCHARAGFEFEQPGTLYRNSEGHKHVKCAACHGSPHAITPTLTQADNAQAMALQGHTGPINDCTVCHIYTPGESFFHRVED